MKRKIIVLLMTSMIIGLILSGCSEKEETKEEIPNTEVTEEEKTDEDETETDIIVVTETDAEEPVVEVTEADEEEADVDQSDVDQADTDQVDTEAEPEADADTEVEPEAESDTEQEPDTEPEGNTEESAGATEAKLSEEMNAELDAETAEDLENALRTDEEMKNILGNWLKYEVFELESESFDSNGYSLSYYSDTDLNDMVSYFHMLLSDTTDFAAGMYAPEMGIGASLAGTLEGMRTVVMIDDDGEDLTVGIWCRP